MQMHCMQDFRKASTMKLSPLYSASHLRRLDSLQPDNMQNVLCNVKWNSKKTLDVSSFQFIVERCSLTVGLFSKD